MNGVGRFVGSASGDFRFPIRMTRNLSPGPKRSLGTQVTFGSETGIIPRSRNTSMRLSKTQILALHAGHLSEKSREGPLYFQAIPRYSSRVWRDVRRPKPVPSAPYPTGLAHSACIQPLASWAKSDALSVDIFGRNLPLYSGYFGVCRAAPRLLATDPDDAPRRCLVRSRRPAASSGLLS